MKRWVVRILVLLIIGAVVNIAVAWGCAMWLRVPSASNAVLRLRTADRDVWLGVNCWRTFGTAVHEMHSQLAHFQPGDEELDILVLDDRRGPAWSGREYSVPIVRASWSQIGPSPAGDDIFVEAEQARGWPALSLWSCLAAHDMEENQPGIDPRPLANGITPKGEPYMVGYGPFSTRVLPLRPIWPGFAVNTLFYAAVLWTLFIGPAALRSQFRFKRGRCVKCGYDLRGEYAAGCPECGWNRGEAET